MPLSYITTCFTKKLNPWYFLKLAFKYPCDKAPWNHFPLNSEPSYLLLLSSAISFTCRLHLNHFLGKKDLHMQTEAQEKCFWIRLVSTIPNTHHCQQVTGSGVLLAGEGGSSGNTRLQINSKGITSPLLPNSYLEHNLRRHSHWTDNAGDTRSWGCAEPTIAHTAHWPTMTWELSKVYFTCLWFSLLLGSMRTCSNTTGLTAKMKFGFLMLLVLETDIKDLPNTRTLNISTRAAQLFWLQ